MFNLKSKLAALGAAVSAGLLPAVAGATTTVPTADSFLSITSEQMTAAVGYVSTIATDFWPIIALAIGVPLAMYFIKKVASMAPGN